MEPEIIEKIWLVNIALCYSGKFTTRVAMMAEEAEEQEVASGAGIQIYMDGSGVEGQVGAVAVLFNSSRWPKVLQYWLGTLAEHTTFKVEAIRVLLGLHMLQYKRQVRGIRLMLDNQAVMGPMDACKSGPAQHIINEVL